MYTLLLIACAPTTPPLPAAPDVLLISLDTTRADALSSWGGTDGKKTTPNLDDLASRGARFAWALSSAPSTLSSHATVFTGLDPHGTQIVRNGFALSTDVETMTERLAAAGYDTMGVLGSSALGRPMNIDQGFRVWDETFTEKRSQRNEARAKSVTDRAIAAMAQREPGKPMFLFAHYFDAHSPYAPPKAFQHRWSEPGKAKDFGTKDGALKGLASQIRSGADPATWADELTELHNNYLSEVSYVDAEVARLLREVDASRTIIVVFGDHGEAFGEIPVRPFGHGMDCDLFETHVPLIVVAPETLGGPPDGAVIETPVGLINLATTILHLAGLPGALGQGEDLSPLWSPDPPAWHQAVLSEATVPDLKRRDGWNNLDVERGVARDGLLLLRSPVEDNRPWLYRIAVGQPRVDDPARTSELDGLLRDWDTRAPPHRESNMTDATREGLKALGYAE